MGYRSRVLAVVQAGGQGSRMDVLTRERAKPALPFAGAYRLVDFVMSSLSHSGIGDVWLSVQYQAASLDPHLSGGRPWDLDRTHGGFRRVVPEQGTGGGVEEGFSHGNADDLLHLRDDIERFDGEVVLVLSADHVFALDLTGVVEAHLASGADCTVVTAEVNRTEARHNVVVLSDGDGRVTGVEVKPSSPSATTVAVEILAYRSTALVGALDELRRTLSDAGELEDGGLGDFGEHLLPHMIRTGHVRTYAIGRYWRDVGRPEAYLAAHRDLIAGRVDALTDRRNPVLSTSVQRSPGVVHAGAQVEDSVVGLGADVRGRVVRSVLGPGVVVQGGALVQDSVLFDDVLVEAGAQVRTCIVDERVVVGRQAVVGADAPSTNPRDKDITLVGRDSRIARRSRVAAGARLEPGTRT
jgi:glucose-1-phosphate adenylyltransferase